jgi:hypothetical protein
MWGDRRQGDKPSRAIWLTKFCFQNNRPLEEINQLPQNRAIRQLVHAIATDILQSAGRRTRMTKT